MYPEREISFSNLLLQGRQEGCPLPELDFSGHRSNAREGGTANAASELLMPAQPVDSCEATRLSSISSAALEHAPLNHSSVLNPALQLQNASLSFTMLPDELATVAGSSTSLEHLDGCSELSTPSPHKLSLPADLRPGFGGLRHDIAAASEPICHWLQEMAPKTTTLTLHWLSPPKTVLVVCKPAPKVRPYFLGALSWLRSRGLSVFVEPAMWDVVVDSHLMSQRLRPRLDADTSVVGDTAEEPQASEENAGLSLDMVMTWGVSGAGQGASTLQCSRAPLGSSSSIPDELAQKLDFVLVLGGMVRSDIVSILKYVFLLP